MAPPYPRSPVAPALRTERARGSKGGDNWLMDGLASNAWVAFIVQEEIEEGAQTFWMWPEQ
jgi:hypothetical protein